MSGSKVVRYDLPDTAYRRGIELVAHKDYGRWVPHADYKALEEENKANIALVIRHGQRIAELMEELAYLKARVRELEVEKVSWKSSYATIESALNEMIKERNDLWGSAEELQAKLKKKDEHMLALMSGNDGY